MARLKTLDERIKNNDLPPPAEYKTPEEVYEAYTSGKEQGAIYDPTGQEKIQAEAESMGFGDAEQVARAGGFEGQGKGKLILAYKNAWDLAGTEKAFRSYPNQITGDCLLPSSPVTMEDGSEKRIDSIVEGDVVRTPQGKTQKVLSLFKKGYNGDTVIVSTGKHEVRTTPDHKFLTESNEWIEARDLETNVILKGVEGPARVKSLSRIDWSGPVHCFEVADDHAFYGGGLAVHNCVAHSNRNALVLAVANAAANGEGSFPTDMEDNWKNGGFLTSCNWWLRGYSGSGWSCGKALSCSKTIGLVVSRKWGGSVNMDLSVYNKSTNGAYGSKSPPDAMKKELGVNTVKAYTRLSDKGFEIIEDYLSSGAAISSCGNEGWSKSRDEWGFSKRSGSWAHALCICGSDSTPEAINRYGEPLLLIQNSWATWNGSDPRHCHGDPNLPRQPVGSFWAKYSDAKKRDMYAVSSVASFPNRKLKNWDLSDLV